MKKTPAYRGGGLRRRSSRHSWAGAKSAPGSTKPFRGSCADLNCSVTEYLGGPSGRVLAASSADVPLLRGALARREVAARRKDVRGGDYLEVVLEDAGPVVQNHGRLVEGRLAA